MSDIDYTELYGLSEEMPEVAEPAEVSSEESGVNEQEFADPPEY